MASRLGAVSPHLDDLALSCADLLSGHPGSSMVTVFAGGPSSVDPMTGWEALSGVFEPGADVVGTRRGEDARAIGLLGGEHHHLEHWDDQYRHPVYRYEGPVGEALVRAIASDLETLVTRLDSPPGSSPWASAIPTTRSLRQPAWRSPTATPSWTGWSTRSFPTPST